MQSSENLKSFHFIINPVSGIGKKLKVVEELKNNLPPYIGYGISFTTKKGHATKIAQEAINRKVDAVIAVGGDGTVNEVSQALISSNMPMGVIPCGSGNGFARHLNIPLQHTKAIEKLIQFKLKQVDAAAINGDFFIASAGFGFDAIISNKFNRSAHRGFLSYLQISINEFFHYRSKLFKLKIDGKTMEEEAFLITVANVGQYGNNAWIAPDASIQDGKLDVCIIKPFPPQDIPDIVLKLFSKKIHQSPFYKRLMAESIVFENIDEYHLDGESKTGGKKLSIQVIPKALKVIC